MKNPKEIFQAPKKLADNTQTAVIISCLALILAGIAVFAAAHRGGGEH